MALCDGTRNITELSSEYFRRTNINLSHEKVQEVINTLDEYLMLDNDHSQNEIAKATDSYRSRPFRLPSLAGEVYARDPDTLLHTLDAYCEGTAPLIKVPDNNVVGLITPHIDYARGWHTYSIVWQTARQAIRDSELIILLGSDHSGSPNSITPTLQDYSTPWGVLPTEKQLVNRVAGFLGKDRAFAEEGHHIGEHSIELAAVWLHYIAERKPKKLLPLLCGPIHPTKLSPSEHSDSYLWKTLEYLREISSDSNILVIAAGDLSHMGPVFGDGYPITASERTGIKISDQLWLDAACTGDSSILSSHIRFNGDNTRICGASPIHYMVSILTNATGKVIAYDQCPAQDKYESIVSIAGVVYTS